MKFKILVLALVLAAATPAFAQSKDKEEPAIVGLIKQMIEAQLKYDAGSLAQIFTADYIEISPLGEFDPRDKVLGFYKPALNPGDKFKADAEATEISLRRYGKFAVLITQLNYKIVSDGKALPPRGIRATFVCRKEKNGWKIASAQYTGIRPPAPAPPKVDK